MNIRVEKLSGGARWLFAKQGPEHLRPVAQKCERRELTPLVPLRCMHSYGLCLWQLGRLEETERIFNRMLWLNPPDNQGVRFLIEEVRAGTGWEESEDGW